MNIFTRHKNILFIIIALIVVFFGYWYFALSKKTTTPAKTTTTGGLVKTTETPSALAGSKSYDKEFVAGLLNLNSINLDISMFESVPYKALSFPEKPFAVDYDIPYGRQNPFLPIGVNAVGVLPSITTQNNPIPTPEPVENPSETTVAATTTPAATTTAPVQPIKKTFPPVKK